MPCQVGPARSMRWSGFGDIAPTSTDGPRKATPDRTSRASDRLSDRSRIACAQTSPVRVVPQVPMMLHSFSACDPFASAFPGTSRDAGYPVVDDVSAPVGEGAGTSDMNVKDGRRYSVAQAYLLPVLDARANHRDRKTGSANNRHERALRNARSDFSRTIPLPSPRVDGTPGWRENHRYSKSELSGFFQTCT